MTLTLGAGAPPGKAAAGIEAFLEKTYWSLAETLPHEHLAYLCKSEGNQFWDGPKFAMSQTRLDIGKADFDTKTGREELVAALLESALCSSPGFHQQGPNKLVRRYLPPGKYADLYRLYTAYAMASDMGVASSATFYRVLKNSGWKKKLRHRGTSTHTKCSVCHRLKDAIRKSTSLQSHAENADRLMRHIGGQFADRRCYWQLRERATHDRDILVLIQDSMDRTKFRLPRFTEGAVPKALDQKPRPECELTASIAHGRGIFVYITDPEQSFGTNWNIEVLSRTLADMLEHVSNVQ